MKNSKKRIDTIIDYLSSYEAKIRLLNRNGLFDEAKLFEIFALEICQVLYKMSFTNSNTQKFNHPHIDLISEDGELNIQVTTRGDIQNKIKSTLVDIRDSSNSEAKKIKRVMFLVLHNDKMKDIVSYKEKNRLGIYHLIETRTF